MDKKQNGGHSPWKVRYERNPQDFLTEVWWFVRLFIYLRLVSDRAGESSRLKLRPAQGYKISCGHEQTIEFRKLKSGKLRRRKNENLFERVRTSLWCGFLFHIFFSTGLPEPNLRGSGERRGSHLSFSLMNHLGLVQFMNYYISARWRVD